MRKILLVGLGGMGKVHYLNLRQLKDRAVVAAAVGKGQADRETAGSYALPFYETMGEAFRDMPEINLVDITTPSFLHKDNVMEALSYGRDVICEKPLALNSSDARMMFSAAREKKLKLLAAHVLRYTNEYNVLYRLVKGGEYGRVLDASFTRLSQVPSWAQGGWLFDKSKSGLIPFDLHIHDLDMIIGLFGAPVNVSSYARRSKDREYDEYLHVIYEYNGFSVKAEAGWLNAAIPFTAVWRVVFEKAVAVNNGNEISVFTWDGKTITPDISYEVTVSTGINIPPTGWYYQELKTLLYVLSSSQEAPVKEGEVLKELEILETL